MTRLFTSARFSTVISLAGMLLLCGTTLAFAGALDPRTLRYSVTEGSMTVGELEVILERDDRQIKSTVIAHLDGLAKLLLGEFTAETWFHLDSGRAILDRGLLRRGEGDPGSGFMVDYVTKIVKLDNGTSYPILPGELLDSTEFPVALITADLASVAGKVVWEVNARRARRYLYHAPKPEMLELDGRVYNTWKVTRNKIGDTHRTVTFWLDPSRQNIPLKIVTVRKDRKTTLSLRDHFL